MPRLPLLLGTMDQLNTAAPQARWSATSEWYQDGGQAAIITSLVDRAVSGSSTALGAGALSHGTRPGFHLEPTSSPERRPRRQTRLYPASGQKALHAFLQITVSTVLGSISDLGILKTQRRSWEGGSAEDLRGPGS